MRQSANRCWPLWELFPDDTQHSVSDQPRAFRVERGPLAVKVVVGLAAIAKRSWAPDEASPREQSLEGGNCISMRQGLIVARD